ncbi:hypothetical protein CIPAW_11G058100 [Carya illinoinensis]|uniref:Uncharacterized protein n=1 Tax=Carya illinoinensis TaxID=32201 RepID=A0A8T1P289_CARIL|nr:hypothetical protein CIPAW_11G058100 [Carya illinoinensis]
MVINLQSCSFKILSCILFFVTLLLPTISGDCTCDAEATETHNSSTALKYKLGSIACILVASAIGVCIPLLGKKFPALSPENDIFFMIKAFAAGVILATGFIHILPDAFDKLTSPCLDQNPWGNFPFTGFFTMVSAIGTLMVDTYATNYYERSHFNKQVNADEERSGSEHAGHVLELGIVFHSVIIGVDMGASQSVGTIKPLLVALSFHQFFEGIGLGGCISQAKFKSRSAAIMATFFSVTTPLGIAIGIGISSTYKDNSQTALIVEGSFNALAAGILIYMALVDLLAADFMNPRVKQNVRIQIGVNFSLLLGAGCMSLLAKWA